jgi:hypothetical protein
VTKPRPPRTGNPVTSPWYSTPREARKRPVLTLSVDPATPEALERLGAAWGLSKSAVVDRLATEALASLPDVSGEKSDKPPDDEP